MPYEIPWQEIARKNNYQDSKSLLVDWYYIKGRPLREIAEKLKTSAPGVTYEMERLNLPRNGVDYRKGQGASALIELDPDEEKKWNSLAEKFMQSSMKMLLIVWYYKWGLGLSEAARKLGITEDQVRRKMADYKLPLRKLDTKGGETTNH